MIADANQPELKSIPSVFIRQRYEMAEFFGFETRNKYEIASEQGLPIAYAAEQQKGILALIARHFFGHWRRFDILFFTPQRQNFMRGHHPFRFFFQRMEIYGPQNQKLGALQSRFAVFSKRFDIEDALGNVVMSVRSPFFNFWKFEFQKHHRVVATVTKKWSGLLTEIFSDKDNFRLEFQDSNTSEIERRLLLAAALFVDLQYFERKASN